jgi:carboxymethylenebutenolidase
MGTRRAELAAVVILYGGGPITDTQKLGSLAAAGPVLGIYGEQDASIPVAQVRAFEKAMKERGVTATVSVYPGVGHAFVKSSTYAGGGAPQQAWEQVVGFLDRTLK